MNQEEPVLNLKNITSTTYLTEEEVMEAYSRLIGINLIDVNVVKSADGTREEIISLDNIIKQATTDITNTHKKKEKTNLFEIFESEFGCPLSRMEYEIINDWLDQGINEDLIIEALREATYCNAKNLRFVNKILLTWQSKGYKNKDDIKKEFKRENEDNLLSDMFDWNWLEDEED